MLSSNALIFNHTSTKIMMQSSNAVIDDSLDNSNHVYDNGIILYDDGIIFLEKEKENPLSVVIEPRPRKAIEHITPEVVHT